MSSRWRAKWLELLAIMCVSVAVYFWIVFMGQSSSEPQAVFGRARLPKESDS